MTALILVMGVFASLTLPDPVGVVADDEARPAFFFAAFSARRFCFDADGAMMDRYKISWRSEP